MPQITIFLEYEPPSKCILYSLRKKIYVIISVRQTYMDKAWIFLVYFLKLLICFHTYDFLCISTHTNQVGNTLKETTHHRTHTKSYRGYYSIGPHMNAL